MKQINSKYGCVSYTEGIFTYKVCLGESIQQIADSGDTYSLGSIDRIVDGTRAVQTYKDGTMCEAAHANRKSTIEFTCGEHKEARVLGINEHSVCQYRFTIGVREVCGHPQFATVSKVESWLLELAEADDGSVICQTYNNGFDVVGSTTFSKFSLAFTSSSLELAQHVVRQKNRRAVADADLHTQASPGLVATQKSTQIDFAKIVGK